MFHRRRVCSTCGSSGFLHEASRLLGRLEEKLEFDRIFHRHMDALRQTISPFRGGGLTIGRASLGSCSRRAGAYAIT